MHDHTSILVEIKAAIKGIIEVIDRESELGCLTGGDFMAMEGVDA